MLKEVGAFSLIIFLFVILAAWWAVSSFKPLHPSTSNYSSVAGGRELVHLDPITIYHSQLKGSEVYSGSVTIPSCDEFLTGISASGQAPAHLHLSFQVTKASVPCQTPGVSPIPFNVSFSSSKNSAKPILDSVDVNNAAATFSIVEVK